MYYVVRSMKETTVTRKYQITIPRDIRKYLGIRIGEKYPITMKDHKIIIETKPHVQRPSDYLWGISKKYTNIDVVHLVKGSRKTMR